MTTEQEYQFTAEEDQEFNAAILEIKKADRFNYLKVGAGFILLGVGVYALLAFTFSISSLVGVFFG